MTTLIFVRHGQSEGNLTHRFMGHHETPLTERGHRQAEATARYLETFPIDRIYSSDLARSMDTARPTAARHGLAIIPDRRFREIDAGEWEGHTYEELCETHAESYGKWIREIGYAHPEGGESVLELAARVREGVSELLRENRDCTVAIFTHATPVRMMACEWFGLPYERAAEVPFCTNASVSVAEYDGDRFSRLIQYSYDTHQGELATKLPRGIV